MRNSTIITIIVLVLILLIALFFVLSIMQNQADKELQASPAAQVLQTNASSTPFTDFDGNNADLDQYLGQVLVVNSWASWAPDSGAELQLLSKTAQAYSQEGVVVIGINRSESKATADRYLEYIGVADAVKLIVDADDRYYKAIGGYTMPETLFYDRKGNVIAHERGPLSVAEVNYHIEAALAVEQ